jgi:hypothetical protein
MITIDALFSPAVIMDAREPSAGMTGEWRFVGSGITWLAVNRAGCKPGWLQLENGAPGTT